MNESTSIKQLEVQQNESVLDKIKNHQELTKEDLLEVKKIYVNYAQDIQDNVFKKWFLASDLSRKLKSKKEDTDILLEQLIYFELVVSKIEKGLTYYKIDIDKKELVVVLNEEIERLKLKISYLQDRINKIEKKN